MNAGAYGGEGTVTILWLPAGLSCDGDSVALTAATQPSIEDLMSGTIPNVPRAHFIWPLLDPIGGGAEFLDAYFRAELGELDPFIFVIEGSIPNESLNASGGYFTGFGNEPGTDQPRPVTRWIDLLAPKAWAILAAGTCATYGGIHAMEGNPTGAMGVLDYLGWDWRSRTGVPVVCVPGCPTQPDNLSQTILYLLRQIAGTVPMIPLDDCGRPTWLFTATAHEGCDRGGYYEQGEFAGAYQSTRCLVKLGCWAPVVKCNVPKRGWMEGIGGCPNAGGICIGCTMPGFPDKFMPFMDEPPGGRLSSAAISGYGAAVRTARRITADALDKEPKWRKKP